MMLIIASKKRLSIDSFNVIGGSIFEFVGVLSGAN